MHDPDRGTLVAHSLGLVGAEVLVQQADDRSSFAHGRGDALDGTLTRVARCQHTRHTGLEQQGVAMMTPSCGRLELSTRYEIALRVALDLVGDPLRVRFTT